MADNDYQTSQVPDSTPETKPDSSGYDEPEVAQEEASDDVVSKYKLGHCAPWLKTPEKVFLKEDLDADVLSAACEIRRLASRNEIFARRFEVEDSWEQGLFLRGYQHLLPRQGGGFELPGENSKWGPTAQQNKSNLLNTNIYSKTHDILVGAMCRETPKVQFVPECADYNPDVTAADQAEKFRVIYDRNNNMRDLMRDAASSFCTDDRIVTLTAYWLDGVALGWEGEDEEPVSPETESDTPAIAPEVELNDDELLEEKIDPGIHERRDVAGETGQEGEEQEHPGLDEEKEAVKKDRVPKGVERTEIFGRLSNKVPITPKKQKDMPWIQLFRDVDEATAKAMFPFAADRIKPGGTDSAEIELDRIARLNTELGIQGKYVTGDSIERLTTICWTFVRPAYYYSQEVRESVREELQEMFPDGMLIVVCGYEFMYAQNANMDDFLHVAHALPGNGQNRRSLLSSVMPVQKRLNQWIDLQGDFFVRTVPKRYYDQNFFDIQLMSKQDNVPGGAVPFQGRAGFNFQTVMGTDPPVNSHPSLADFIKWFEGDLNNDISGALASIYGGATDINTAAGMGIQRDQALGRLNAPWNSLQDMFACIHKQAVKHAALNRTSDMDEYVQGSGRVTVELAKMKGGNVLCYPEYDSSFPESSQQKLQRYETLFESLKDNPAAEQLIGGSIKNRKVLKDNLRFSELIVPGAAEYDKQQGEFQILLKTGPIPNPVIAQMQEQVDQLMAQGVQKQGMINQTVQGMQQEHQQNGGLDQQEVQQAAPVMNQLEQQVEQHKQQALQLEQQMAELEQTTPLVSTVPVAPDKSENHAAEAEACYDWLNGPEGRRMAHSTDVNQFGASEQEVRHNVYLHWSEHTAMADKLAPPSDPIKAAMSFSADVTKLPPDLSAQVMQREGFQVSGGDFAQQAQTDVQQDISKRAAPHIIRKLARS